MFVDSLYDRWSRGEPGTYDEMRSYADRIGVPKYIIDHTYHVTVVDGHESGGVDEAARRYNRVLHTVLERACKKAGYGVVKSDRDGGGATVIVKGRLGGWGRFTFDSGEEPIHLDSTVDAIRVAGGPSLPRYLEVR